MIPDYLTIILLLLKMTSDKKEHKINNLFNNLANPFKLTDEESTQKAQISKIENNAKDVQFSTILKVFDTLKAKVRMTIDFITNSHLELV